MKAALLKEARAWRTLARRLSKADNRGNWFPALWTDDMNVRFCEHMRLVDPADQFTDDPVLDMLWLEQECREEAKACGSSSD